MTPFFKTTVFCWFLILGALQALTAQETEDFLVPLIELNPNGELTILKASCKNNTDAPLYLHYVLEITQKNASGQTSDQHQGEFDILPRKEKLLVNASINFTPNDFLQIVLQLFSGDKLVAADSLTRRPGAQTLPAELLNLAEALIEEKRKTKEELGLDSPTNKSDQAPKPQDIPKVSATITPPPSADRLPTARENIDIDGLIIDETRTKIAHDFYDLFYQKWIAPEAAKDFIIYIKELPAQGRIARVALLINEDQVIERVLSPRADVVEEQVDICINALTRHLENKEKVESQLGSEDAQGSGIF